MSDTVLVVGVRYSLGCLVLNTISMFDATYNVGWMLVSNAIWPSTGGLEVCAVFIFNTFFWGFPDVIG